MSTHEYLLNKYGTTLTFEQASQEIGCTGKQYGKCVQGEI